MNMNNRMIKYSISFMLAFSLLTASFLPSAIAAPTLLKQGMTNENVPDLQYRLMTRGYFNGPVTSYFGNVTSDALKRFQLDYGLTVDGIAGPQSWKRLKMVSANAYEMELLARIIHAEARGETYVGQVAVGAVVMNRLASDKFPNTIRGIIEEPGAFTAVDDGQYAMKPDSSAYKAAFDAVRGYDPTKGSLYYFNPETATSKWIWSREQTVQIGSHIFAI